MFGSVSNQLTRARIIGGAEDPGISPSVGISGPLSVEADREMYSSARIKLRNFLSAAGYRGSQYKKIELLLIMSLAFCLMAAFVTAKYYLIALWGVPLGLLYLICSARCYRRAEAFERDYPTLLISLASSVKTGLDPCVALAGSDRMFAEQSEVARAIRAFSEAIERGESEEKAISEFACDINHPDIQLFRSAFLLARKHGSSLGECLYRLTRVTRQRQSFRRKMRAAVAMQKLSAIGIGGCAVTIAIMQYISNRQALNAAFDHPIGFKLLLLGFSLIVFGLLWMLFMARARL